MHEGDNNDLGAMLDREDLCLAIKRQTKNVAVPVMRVHDVAVGASLD